MENKANTTLDVTDPLELAKNIQSEFQSNMVVKKKKTQSKKPWYNSYLHDLRKIMMDSMYMFKTGKIEHNSYTLARNAYHKALRATQFNYNQKMVDDLIERGRNEGINCLYKMVKSKSSTCIGNMEKFYQYCTKLFATSEQPVIENKEENNPKGEWLGINISADEVFLTLKTMKSRATSTYSVSPYNLNQLKDVISTPLSKVFSYCLN